MKLRDREKMDTSDKRNMVVVAVVTLGCGSGSGGSGGGDCEIPCVI